MTHEETKKILRVMCATYSNFAPPNMAETIEIWEMMLGDYPYEAVAMALKTYIMTNSKGFAPTIAELNAIIQDLAKKSVGKAELSPSEAWALVYKAICNGTYNSETEFNKLPQLVQKAVGSPENIKAMATDSNFNIGVEQSHFIRAYERATAEAKQQAMLPESIKELIGGITDGNDKRRDKTKLLGSEE